MKSQSARDLISRKKKPALTDDALPFTRLKEKKFQLGRINLLPTNVGQLVTQRYLSVYDKSSSTKLPPLAL